MARISRRTFVANTAALAGTGLLPRSPRPALAAASAAEIPRRPFGNTGAQVTINGIDAYQRM